MPLIIGPVRSALYLGGDDVLVLGQAFGIYSDEEPFDYLTVASLIYGTTSYDCNYLWPFNINYVVVEERTSIIVSAYYKRLVKWGGYSEFQIEWSKRMEDPEYLAYDDGAGIVFIEKDRTSAVKVSTADGGNELSAKLPFEVIAQPMSLEGGGLLLIGEGRLAVLGAGLEVTGQFDAPWLTAGAAAAFDGASAYVVSSGTIAKFRMK